MQNVWRSFFFSGDLAWFTGELSATIMIQKWRSLTSSRYIDYLVSYQTLEFRVSLRQFRWLWILNWSVYELCFSVTWLVDSITVTTPLVLCLCYLICSIGVLIFWGLICLDQFCYFLLNTIYDSFVICLIWFCKRSRDWDICIRFRFCEWESKIKWCCDALYLV